MSHDQLPYSAEVDRDLRRRVRAFLQQRGYGLQKALEIKAERGAVLVQGQVPTYYLRQIAVELIKRVAGVTRVVDLIQVVDGSIQSPATDSSVGEQPASATAPGVGHPLSMREVPGTLRRLVHSRPALSTAQNELLLERTTR